MIQIKRCNYITGNSVDVTYAVKKIVDFLEMEGRNPILFCRPKSSGSNGTILTYMMEPKIDFNNIDDFTKSINDKGNLFRVDLMIFDFWHLSVSSIIEYKKVIDKIGIDYIILAKEYHYKTSDDVNDYHVKFESRDNRHHTEYSITDKISGWTSNLENLSKSYIRNKKIDDLFNKDGE